jgi:hypothetical protein
MTDFKKGGPLQNSNIFATNRLFVKNKLFKKRKKKRAPGVYNPKAKFKYEDGGEKDYIELDLSKEDIDKYVKGGYIVEEVTDPSIATLNRFIGGGALEKLKPGGANKGCPPGTYWNGTKCTKLVTLKNDKKYIDGVAAWDMHVTNNEVRNLITPEYNDQIKDRLYSGKWGFDPESGALIRLDKIQPQSVTKLDDKTKASREKEKKQQEALRNKWESEDTYRQSIIDAGFDPATFGKAKGTNVITGEPIYASSKEEADRINQEAINQAAIEGHAAVVNNPVFKTAAYMTPVGMAIGTIEGLARLAPDAYDFAKDPSWSGAGQVAMDALELAPFAGKGLGKAVDLAGDAGKFITTQTPLKNTYKILGKDSKFFNPGETPHWRKGYQETWDPEIADLSPLKEFDQKLKTSELNPKFKKQFQKITNKNNSITRNYSSNIQKAKGDPELIKKAEIERQSAMDEMKGVTDKFYDDVLNYKIKKYSPFEKELGSGSFGRVFSIPGSDKVVKIGRQAPGETPEELIKKAQGLDKPNVALPRRIENLEGVVDATVMNKVDNLENSPESIISGTHIKPSSQAYEQLVYDIQDLQDKGLYVDFQNPDNIIFNPQTGKFNIYDLNTTGHYMSQRITPDMGYSFKADTQFPGIMVPDVEGLPVSKILKDHRLIPDNFHLPNYVESETKNIADNLIYRKANPYHVRNIKEGYGKGLVATVTKGKDFSGDEAIALKKYTDASGKDNYYFNAAMHSPVEAGRAFKMLESEIPKGAFIQEPESLSLDSWSSLIKQAQNPKKFTVHPGNKVPLNVSAIHKKLPNQDKLLKGLEDESGWESKIASFATREDAQEAVDYINSLIPEKFRAAKANVFQKDPNKSIFSIAVPNFKLEKLYKKGGATNDYIEIDIPEEEIQKYIAQGYIVEPVSKLKKFIS